MFYLLENNKIIDTNEQMNNVDNVVVEKQEDGKYLYLQGWLGVHFCGKIKKQSENVFDLIEEGDLLYMPFDCNGTMVHRFDMFKCYKYNAFHCSIHIVHEKGILAIYKPDDKGNYIKVWEREEDDDK